MEYQTSETHEQFRNEPDTIPAPEFTPNPQGFMLSNHHTDGPSKVIRIKIMKQYIFHCYETIVKLSYSFLKNSFFCNSYR